eukprot:sb/3466204/
MEDPLEPQKVADVTCRILNEISIKETKTLISYKKFTQMKAQSVIEIVKELRLESLAVVKKISKDMRSGQQQPHKQNMVADLIDASRLTGKTNTLLKHNMVFDKVVDDIMTVCLVTDNLVKQTCTLFMILEKYPTIQERMFKELREVEVESNRDLRNLKFTEKCILEGMRMAPALLRGLRTSSQREKPLNADGSHDFAGYKIYNKGFRIAYNHYVMHHDEEYWTDPYTFNPDRWTEDFVPAEFSYTPFWAGSRGCIGKHLAMMLMKLTLSGLAKRYDVEQKFDKENPPLINQNVAPMKLINERKTLKSGCLPLLTIRRFWHSRRVRAVVRVWLGFGLGVSVSAIDSLSDAV